MKACHGVRVYDDGLYRRLAIHAAERGVRVSVVVEDALAAYFQTLAQRRPSVVTAVDPAREAGRPPKVPVSASEILARKDKRDRKKRTLSPALTAAFTKGRASSLAKRTAAKAARDAALTAGVASVPAGASLITEATTTPVSTSLVEVNDEVGF